MLKVWGRNTSSNVQKVMWAIGEMNLPPIERIDLAGPFGKNKEPAYLAINPNGLVPTLEEEEGFTLWESNSILRYLAAKHKSFLEPADLRVRANAQKWMDWQLSVAQPAIFPLFMVMLRTPAEKRDPKAVEEIRAKMVEVMKILDAQLARTEFVAGDFSYGDIPLGIVGHRFTLLVPERPKLPGVERWYAALKLRPSFVKHVTDIPLT
jgi:glutathione S-transferase